VLLSFVLRLKKRRMAKLGQDQRQGESNLHMLNISSVKRLSRARLTLSSLYKGPRFFGWPISPSPPEARLVLPCLGIRVPFNPQLFLPGLAGVSQKIVAPGQNRVRRPLGVEVVPLASQCDLRFFDGLLGLPGAIEILCLFKMRGAELRSSLQRLLDQRLHFRVVAIPALILNVLICGDWIESRQA
jgi:hypothetical protein